MADTAASILSVEDIKQELRIPASETDHDGLLEAHIEAAVSFVSEYIATPLIDHSEILYLPRPGKRDSLWIRCRDVKEVTSVQYWDKDGDRREDPNQIITTDALGRIQPEGGAMSTFGPRSTDGPSFWGTAYFRSLWSWEWTWMMGTRRSDRPASSASGNSMMVTERFAPLKPSML